MPRTGYRVLTVRKDLAPRLRSYYKELLLAGEGKGVGEKEVVELSFKLSPDEYEKIKFVLEDFFEFPVPVEELFYSFVEVCERLMRSTQLAFLAHVGAFKELGAIFRNVFVDLERLEEDLDWTTNPTAQFYKNALYRPPITLLTYMYAKEQTLHDNWISARDISETTGLHRETTATMLGELERDGLLETTQEEEGDQERMAALYCRLTEHGRKMADLLIDTGRELKVLHGKAVDATKTRHQERTPHITLHQLTVHGEEKYGIQLHFLLTDFWYYLTIEDRRNLAPLVRRTISGTLFTAEALRALMESSWRIAGAEELLSRMSDKLLTAQDLKRW